jgi:hypothetical protein
MLFLVSIALRAFPLLLPQAVSLVTGMDPLDPEFQRKWTACLERVGRRLIAPISKNGDAPKRDKTGGAEKGGKRSPSHAAAGGGRHQGT